MTDRILEAIRRFQEEILELGVSGATLSSPTPRMLAGDVEPASLFQHLVTEVEIVNVCRDLFASGHYSLAVQEAFKAVDQFVGRRVGLRKPTGTALMELVFSPKDPALFWTERLSPSQVDEQLGYHRLYSGAMLGIRNPVTHEFNWVDDPHLALELISFAQHLLRRAKLANVKR